MSENSQLGTGLIGDWRSIAAAAVYVAAGVIFIHLFEWSPDHALQTVIHGLAVLVSFTFGFLAGSALVGALSRAFPFGWRDILVVRVALSTLAAFIVGAAALAAAEFLFGELLPGFHHGPENWGLKLLVIGLVITAALVQFERVRLLDLALSKLNDQKRGAPPAYERPGAEVALRSGKTVYRISPAAIACVEAEANYCLVRRVDRDRPLMIRATISSVAELLGSPVFARIHRSCLVNLAHVARVERRSGRYVVALTNGQVMPLARDRVVWFADLWEERLAQAGAAPFGEALTARGLKAEA